jgi:hypothetical protein
MKKGMIACVIVIAAALPGCFTATVDTDYNADASKLLAGHPKIPAAAALVLSQEQRDRKDSASKLGVKVTVRTGDSLVVGINKAAVSQMFESVTETDQVSAGSGADIILEPKLTDLITQVHGLGIVIHSTFTGKLSLTAYDKDAQQLWTKEATAKYESPNMFGLKGLTNRNQITTEAYEAFLPTWKEIYDDFYASDSVMDYLRSIGKAP